MMLMLNLKEVIQGFFREFLKREISEETEDAIQRQVRGKETQKHLLKQLAFENSNEESQVMLLPIKEKDDIMGYLRASRTVGSKI